MFIFIENQLQLTPAKIQPYLARLGLDAAYEARFEYILVVWPIPIYSHDSNSVQKFR